MKTPYKTPVHPPIKQKTRLSSKKSQKSLHIQKKTPNFATQNAKGAIAQLVEQRTENPCVPGSIPGGTTVKIANDLIYRLLAIFIQPKSAELPIKLPMTPPSKPN